MRGKRKLSASAHTCQVGRAVEPGLAEGLFVVELLKLALAPKELDFLATEVSGHVLHASRRERHPRWDLDGRRRGWGLSKVVRCNATGLATNSITFC